MTTRDFTANVISASKVVPDGNFKDSKASGIWDINEALDLIKGGNWPNAANLNPAAFVDALFSTDLWEGNGTARSITNGINLSGSGGLVWFKMREAGFSHRLVDTARGVTKKLETPSQAAEGTEAQGLTAFNSDGFTIGTADNYNLDTYDLCSWTFRKQPKFFDIQTWTGNGSARTISHNLGSVPGMIIIKRLDDSAPWVVYHRSLNNGTNPEQYYIYLHDTGAEGSSSPYMNNTAPTSTEFTLTNDGHVNGNTNTYVAYLFAHNNNDGGFGEPGDQDIIKCGSYDAVDNTAVSVNLGFEPQFIMIKGVSSTSFSAYASWFVQDTMRGMVAEGSNASDKVLYWNKNQAEGLRGNGGSSPSTEIQVHPNSTGFTIPATNSAEIKEAGKTYIYMAIRRGGMQTPTAASSVFSIDTIGSGAPYFDSNHIVDMALVKSAGATGDWYNYARLMGEKYLSTNDGGAEANASEAGFDFMNGHIDSNWGGTNAHSWMWKKARGYFDVATYTGTGSARTVSHNLGAVPEMMWIKNRSAAENWVVYHSGIDSSTPEDYYLRLNQTSARIDIDGGAGNRFNRTAPTASVFTVGTDGDVNGNGVAYISYHFATVANVSKVGSFTQSGATNVACGFTGDTPSFILIKRIDVNDSTSNWWIFDSVRGIVAGNDKSLYLNTTGAEVTNADIVDPYSGGFATTSSLANGDYIFYAIAAIS